MNSFRLVNRQCAENDAGSVLGSRNRETLYYRSHDVDLALLANTVGGEIVLYHPRFPKNIEPAFASEISGEILEGAKVLAEGATVGATETLVPFIHSVIYHPKRFR